MYINASIKGAFGMSLPPLLCVQGEVGSRSTPVPTLLGGRGLCPFSDSLRRGVASGPELCGGLRWCVVLTEELSQATNKA